VTSIAVALMLGAVQAGSAGAAVQSTQEKVRASLSAWFKSQGPARTRAKEQARKAVAELIDFDTLARETLGKKWNELSPKDAPGTRRPQRRDGGQLPGEDAAGRER